MSEIELDDLPQPERVDTVPPEELHVDGDNPNEQSDDLFGLLCENMRKKGWIGNHIVTDLDGCIADGEHRWRAAQEIGLSEVPVKFYDLTDEERRLFRLELNKISGEHDKKRDALEYDRLMSAGYSEDVSALADAAEEDLDDLLSEIRVDTSQSPNYEYNPDHNVYFEDCLDGMAKRIADDSVDFVVTDPPYGVDIKLVGMSEHDEKERRKSLDGDKSVAESIELFDAAMSEIDRVLKPGKHLAVFASWKTAPQFREVIESNGFQIVNYGVWIKKDANQLTFFGGGERKPTYAYKHEFILFAVRSDDEPYRQLTGYPDDVFEYTEARWSDVTDQKTNHPTQKPVALIEDLIVNSTDPEDLVLDPFMGSGTTAVASVFRDRDYIGFEIDADTYKSVVDRRLAEAHGTMDASVNNPEDNTDEQQDKDDE